MTEAEAKKKAKPNPKYAGYVYDVVAGKALYSENASAKRFPASLTKIMTVYVMFEEIKAGRMKFRTAMGVSKYAAGRPPSKIWVKPGTTITARDAIKALVTKSANDVAVVVAEHISGSEAAFARRMTKTARRLGMKSTTFKNANGLPNRNQVTTARDMATLGLAIQRDFPSYYGVFQTRTFQYGKKRYRNHNRLLGTVKGVDGIKTGYIRASGFNLVTSVRRNGKHIVAVVMGGRTGASRNAHMKSLIARTLPKAKRGSTMPLLAFNDSDPPPIPTAKPAMATLYAARFKASAKAASDGDAISTQIVAFAAETRRSAGPVSAYDPNTLTAVINEAAEAGLPSPPLPEVTKVAIAPSAPATRSLAVTSNGFGDAATSSDGTMTDVARHTGPPRSGLAAPSPDRVASAFATFEKAAPAKVDKAALLAAIGRARLQQLRDRHEAGDERSGSDADPAQTSALQPSAMSPPASLPAPAVTVPSSSDRVATDQTVENRVSAVGSGSGSHRRSASIRAGRGEDVATAAVVGEKTVGWQIQIGAVASRDEADALLSNTVEKFPSVSGLSPVTIPVRTTRGTLYRARFAGFENQRQAIAACKRFANHNRPCWAVSM
ncbi:MAG: SPOR domain-containing protein [Pseudomonadota bacterium]